MSAKTPSKQQTSSKELEKQLRAAVIRFIITVAEAVVMIALVAMLAYCGYVYYYAGRDLSVFEALITLLLAVIASRK